MRKPPLQSRCVPTAGAAAEPVVTLAALPSSGKPTGPSVDFSWMRTGTKFCAASARPAQRGPPPSLQQTAGDPVTRAPVRDVHSGLQFSATIAAFSAAVHGRRHEVPVISSIQRYSPPSCLC